MNPLCKTVSCKRELTYMEETKCYRCLVCNPLPKAKLAAPTEEKSRYVDVPWTEERIRAIVHDELQNWHVPKPSVTAKEVTKLTTTEPSGEEPQRTWRDVAKEMNVPLYDHDRKCPRKKDDVLEDIKKAG